MLKDEKYIVFKREDFNQMVGLLGLGSCRHSMIQNDVNDEWNAAQVADHIERFAEKIQIDDAVVIRTRDEIAPPVLDMYASILTLVKGKGDPTADYFHDRAVESWLREDRKLPD